MKWLSLFFVFGLLAVIGSMGSLAHAKPFPEPRGRPPTTTRRPPTTDTNDAGVRRQPQEDTEDSEAAASAEYWNSKEQYKPKPMKCSTPLKKDRRKIIVQCYGEEKLQYVEIVFV